MDQLQLAAHPQTAVGPWQVISYPMIPAWFHPTIVVLTQTIDFNKSHCTVKPDETAALATLPRCVVVNPVGSLV